MPLLILTTVAAKLLHDGLVAGGGSAYIQTFATVSNHQIKKAGTDMSKLEGLIITIVTGVELHRHSIIATGPWDIEAAVAAARNNIVETVARRPQEPLLVLASVAAKLLDDRAVVGIVASNIEAFATVAVYNSVGIAIIITAA